MSSKVKGILIHQLVVLMLISFFFFLAWSTNADRRRLSLPLRLNADMQDASLFCLEMDTFIALTVTADGTIIGCSRRHQTELKS